MNDTERRLEFAEWLFSRDGANSAKVSEKYLTREQQLMWEAWQAAREKLIKLPDEQGIPPMATAEQRHRRSGYNFAIHEVKQAIEAAGYRYE